METATFEFELGFDDVRSAQPKPKTRTVRSTTHGNGKTRAGIRSEASGALLTSAGRGKKRPFSSIVEVDHQPELSVGLDFGMGYTGLAEVSVHGAPFEVRVLKKHPGTLDLRDKVPSLLALKRENASMDFDEEIKTGYEVSSDMNVRGYLKFAMDKNAPATKYDDPIVNEDVGKLMLRTPSGENTIDHATQYLKELYDHYMSKLKGEQPKSFFERQRFSWTIAHPVACSEEGKSNTLKAAKAAGFGSGKHNKCCLISEAEASITAAFACARRNFGPNSFTPKTNVAMLDIGSLTIDSAIYYINAGDPKLKLSPVYTSEGGKCGGITIFCRFYDRCEKRFKDAFTNLPQKMIGPGSRFHKQFESEIRKFTGKNLNKHIRIPLAMDTKDGDHYQMGDIVFDGNDMKTCIDPLLEYCHKILHEQFSTAKGRKGNSKKTSTAVLGGGNALCPYIETDIRSFCQQYPDGPIEVVRPDEAWSLVARGSAMNGLKTRIVEGRVSRAWYGIAGHRKLDPDEDEDEADFDDPINGRRVSGAMKWHVKKGEKIASSTKAKKVDAYVVLSEEQVKNLGDQSGIIPLYQYAGNDEKAPATVDHPDVEFVGNISIDLDEMSDHARNKVKKAFAETKKDQKLALTIAQNVNSASNLITFTVRVGEKSVGDFGLKHGTILDRSRH